MYSGGYNGNKQSSRSYTYVRNAPTSYHAVFPVHHPNNKVQNAPLSPLPPSPLPPTPPKGPKPIRTHMQATRGRDSSSQHPRSMTISCSANYLQQATQIPCPRKREPVARNTHAMPIHTLPQKQKQKQTMQQRVWNTQSIDPQQPEHYTRDRSQGVPNHGNLSPSNSITHTGPIPVAAVHVPHTQCACPLKYMGCNAYHNGHNINTHYNAYQRQHLDHVIVYFENKLKTIQHDYTRKIKEMTITNVNKIEDLKSVNAKQMQQLQQRNEELQGSIDELTARVSEIAVRERTLGSPPEVKRSNTVHSRIPGHKAVRDSKIPATFKEFQKVRTMTEEISDSDSELEMVIEED
eukprot:167004_1